MIEINKKNMSYTSIIKFDGIYSMMYEHADATCIVSGLCKFYLREPAEPIVTMKCK